MGDAENALQPSKKRAAGRELSRDNPGLDEEDTPEQATGTFKRASDDVLATRRMVKVRRNQTTSVPSSNPFARIRLIPQTESGANITEVKTDEQAVSEIAVLGDDGKEVESVDTEKHKGDDGKQAIDGGETKVDANTELVKELSGGDMSEVNKVESTSETGNGPVAGGDETENKTSAGGDEIEKVKPTGGDELGNETNKEGKTDNVELSKDGSHLSSFQQLSNSQNAFTGLAGTGFSTSTFSFGSVGSIPMHATGTNSGFSFSNNGNSSHFGTTGTSIVSKNEGFPSMREVPLETGEENERVIFTADSILFEFIDGGWKERGKGELRVNISSIGIEKARLLMRARGNYRLILNASLYPDMKLTNMDKKGITFACMNCASEGKDGLSTFALKFKDGSVVELFRAVVKAHQSKDQAPAAMKTPETLLKLRMIKSCEMSPVLALLSSQGK